MAQKIMVIGYPYFRLTAVGSTFFLIVIIFSMNWSTLLMVFTASDHWSTTNKTVS